MYVRAGRVAAAAGRVACDLWLHRVDDDVLGQRSAEGAITMLVRSRERYIVVADECGACFPDRAAPDGHSIAGDWTASVVGEGTLGTVLSGVNDPARRNDEAPSPQVRDSRFAGGAVIAAGRSARKFKTGRLCAATGPIGQWP